MSEVKETQPTKEQSEGKKAAKPVKVRALRPFAAAGRVVNPGETVEVEPERVPELTRDNFGSFDFMGERYAADPRDMRRHNLKLAEVVA